MVSMLNRKFLSRCVFVIGLASSLASCGFHLRGSTPLPEALQTLHLDAREGPFRDQMQNILERVGARVLGEPNPNNVQLSIITSEVQRTVGTLDERGKANSYDLNYVVRYTLLAGDGSVLRESALSDRRRYDFDPDIVLETESEEEELIEDMEQSLALRIMRQLSTITSAQPTGVAPTIPGTIPGHPQPEGIIQ